MAVAQKLNRMTQKFHFWVLYPKGLVYTILTKTVSQMFLAVLFIITKGVNNPNVHPLKNG